MLSSRRRWLSGRLAQHHDGETRQLRHWVLEEEVALGALDGVQRLDVVVVVVPEGRVVLLDLESAALESPLRAPGRAVGPAVVRRELLQVLGVDPPWLDLVEEL